MNYYVDDFIIDGDYIFVYTGKDGEKLKYKFNKKTKKFELLIKPEKENIDIIERLEKLEKKVEEFSGEQQKHDRFGKLLNRLDKIYAGSSKTENWNFDSCKNLLCRIKNELRDDKYLPSRIRGYSRKLRSDEGKLVLDWDINQRSILLYFDEKTVERTFIFVDEKGNTINCRLHGMLFDTTEKGMENFISYIKKLFEDD